MKKRVRFAPSPTGFLHVGSAKIALINYLFASKSGGDFVLRIEDTDIERSKQEYEESILESLDWLGLEYDEGPDKKGNFGPYRQSKRLEIYEKYIKKLIETGAAYPCFCSEEELKKEKEKCVEKGEAPKYSGKCRKISDQKRREKLKKGDDYVIRMKVDDEGEIKFEDMIRGEVVFDKKEIGDFVLAKNKKKPLYNLACAIDDHEMKMSHVIRGEDHISNTPKQILIQKALGFDQVKYGHLPLILASDKSKLSKRHGAVAVSEYKKQGFLPEALVNFLVLLGWSPGDDREFFTIEELKKEFSIDRCKKSGAVFNKKKLEYINSLHIKEARPERLAKLLVTYLIQEDLLNPKQSLEEYPPAMGAKGLKTSYKTKDGRDFSFDQIIGIAKEHQDRIKTLPEITEVADYFFETIEADFSLLQWKDMTEDEVADCIDKSINILSDIKTWDKKQVSKSLLEKANEYGDRGRFLWPLRAALTGRKNSAGPFEVAYLLGRGEAIKRLKQAKEIL